MTADEKQILININPSETRIAVIKGDAVHSLLIERAHERGMVGNIYRGKVSRVLPGIQAAFVDIGIGKKAFLYGGDVLDPGFLEKKRLEYEGGLVQDEEGQSEPLVNKTPIENLIQDGQHVTVQVIKDPLGSKGARVSMYLSLPGRYLVLMPDFHHIAISRRITCEQTKEQLIQVISELKPADVGVIVRTVAVGSRKEDFAKELRYLLQQWQDIQRNMHHQDVPRRLYEEPMVHLKTTRDLYDDETTEIIVDDEKAFAEIGEFFDNSIPGARKKLKLYDNSVPLFDEHGIEVEIARALGRKVWLPSGGSLVIDQTEALTSFDVNTGRFVGKMSVDETILKTNLEAVKVIGEQLRLRNIGGIIVIDFIDMQSVEDKTKVFDALEEVLAHDKAKTTVLRISELGLVQMTRKRTSESLEHKLMDSCPYCDSRGRVRSLATETYNMFRDVERYAAKTDAKEVRVKLRPDMFAWIADNQRDLLHHVEKKHDISIELESSGISEEQLKAPAYEVI